MLHYASSELIWKSADRQLPDMQSYLFCYKGNDQISLFKLENCRLLLKFFALIDFNIFQCL